MKNIGRIILDFDNTLFDTSAFKQALSGALVELGVGRDDFWRLYPKVRDYSDSHQGYSVERHARLLHEENSDVDPHQAEILLDRVVNRAPEFLFYDTNKFLSRMISLNVPLIIVSRGDTEFQKRKIAASGIDRFVHDIHVGSERKVNILENLPKQEGGTVFVNDHVEETRDVIGVYSDWIPVLKRRKDIPPEKYLSIGMLNFSTLTEIRDYLTILHATSAANV